MPQQTPTPNQAMGNVAPAINNTQKATTHNERLRQLDLQFYNGDVIQYTDYNNQIKFAMKMADGEYIDMETRKVMDLRSVAPFIMKGQRATFNQIKNQLGKLSSNMMKYKQHMLTVDFETAIKHDKGAGGASFKTSEVFNMTVAGIFGKGENKQLRATNFFVTDIFEDILSSDPSKRSAANAAMGSMSVDVQRGYMQHFRKLATSANISLTDIRSLPQLIKKRETLSSLMGELNRTYSGKFTYSDPTKDQRLINKYSNWFGTKKGVIKHGLVVGSQVKSASENALQVKIDRNVTVGGFNMGSVDEPSMETLGFGRSGEGYNSAELRGHLLFTNASLFPGLTDNIHATLGPSMNKIAHRLGMGDKETQALFQQVEKGIGSAYTPNTAADDFHNALQYAISGNDKLNAHNTRHTALPDTLDEMQTVFMNDQFVDKAIKEHSYQGMRFDSIKGRRIAAFLRSQAVSTMMKESPLYGAKDKKYLMNLFNRKVDMTKLSKEVTGALESTTSYRIERDILHSNQKLLGGNTVSQLLGGALLYTGVRTAVSKARERLLENRTNNMEGVRHDSIPTVIRRLRLTDFGSPRMSNNPVTAFPIIMKHLFKDQIIKPKAIAKTVKRTLSNIAQTIKDTKGKGSFLAMWNDPEKMMHLTNQILGPRGKASIPSMFNRLRRRNIIGETPTIDAAVKKIKDWSGGRILIKELEKHQAEPTVKKNMAESLANLFVTRGKDAAGNTAIKVRAPAVAIGLGGMGALAIMLGRGSYDPEEMMNKMPTRQDIKYYRGYPERKRANVPQTIKDIQNSSHEGIDPGSRETQRLRYTHTDFGSGWRGIIDYVSKQGVKILNTSPTIRAAKLQVTKQVSQLMGGSAPTRVRLNTTRQISEMINSKRPKGIMYKQQQQSTIKKATDIVKDNRMQMNRIMSGTTPKVEFKEKLAAYKKMKGKTSTKTVSTKAEAYNRISSEDVSIKRTSSYSSTSRPDIPQSTIEEGAQHLKLINRKPKSLTTPSPKSSRYVQSHSDKVTGKPIYTRQGTVKDIGGVAGDPQDMAYVRGPTARNELFHDMQEAGKLPQPKRYTPIVNPNIKTPDIVGLSSTPIEPSDVKMAKQSAVAKQSSLKMVDTSHLPTQIGNGKDVPNIRDTHGLDLAKVENVVASSPTGTPYQMSKVGPNTPTLIDRSVAPYSKPQSIQTSLRPVKHEDITQTGIQKLQHLQNAAKPGIQPRVRNYPDELEHNKSRRSALLLRANMVSQHLINAKRRTPGLYGSMPLPMFQMDIPVTKHML